ncbi:hypothetical protein OTK01_000305 [Caldicellulosiruptor acetigenus]|uniref:hypothetical protein n=1 Tax=Caldicellulosiruptor acetigenus TaxID=301953 RepID=UPI0022A91574|nr:hypothetical protein [Caldicellulosiruptor acetigenus]WAM36531.1 hypothetical protein OTK01_000305 [Caldicellulosiruptor acetigenus]
MNDLNGIVKPVTPEEFSNILTRLFVNLLHVVQNFIKPITGLGITIAVLFLLVGYIFHVSTAKKLGASILGGVGLVVIIYLLAPYILGVIYNSVK